MVGAILYSLRLNQCDQTKEKNSLVQWEHSLLVLADGLGMVKVYTRPHSPIIVFLLKHIFKVILPGFVKFLTSINQSTYHFVSTLLCVDS